MIGIYKITSPSGKVYIGQSWDIKKRWYAYKSDSGKGQRHLYNSLKKYGSRNHFYEILTELPKDVTQDILNNYEAYYINQYREVGYELLNLKEGGSNGKHSAETRILIGIKSKGHPGNSTTFKTGHSLFRTAEHSKKISEALKGKVVSNETKKKLSELNSGSRHPKFGKKNSIETRRKISESNKGRVISELHKEKLKSIHRGNKYRVGKTLSDDSIKKISETKKSQQRKETPEQRKKRSEWTKAWWQKRKEAVC